VRVLENQPTSSIAEWVLDTCHHAR
jgi:hypothetical protein